MRTLFGLLSVLLAASSASAQTPDPGRRAFETRCARYHGADGSGGEMGPPIQLRLPARDNTQLAALIREGLPLKGMPPSPIADPELSALATSKSLTLFLFNL